MSRLFVVISGLPGSGKTTVGRVLAPRLGLPLLDKDDISRRAVRHDRCAELAPTASVEPGADLVLQTIAGYSAGVVLSSFWRRERLSSTSGTPIRWLQDLTVVVDTTTDLDAVTIAAAVTAAAAPPYDS